MSNAPIAIIDDDDIFQMLIRKIIEDRVQTTSILQFFSGFMALTYFKENCSNMQQLPSVIFLDLTMPGMSGWQFLQQLEKISFTKSYKPVVFIITGSENLDFEKLRNYPLVKAYLTKPIIPNDFIGLIREVTEKETRNKEQESGN
jgi:CheY-like chemotaxis protein